MRINSQLQYNQFKIEQAQNKINKQNQDRLKEVCEDFESIFLGMMFKQMKDAGFKSKLLDTGIKGKIFKDMYYDKLAKEAAQKSNLGIAEAAYRQLNK
ncbi:Rod binding protein [Halobacteroides halobius DSM 5150]|uniref:Rod binding protein n=1 Tax=Halobacteroides halobius (strain ATCC 35273 / DSM 5150 / MD-1) TaxID=748449 RepID=L0KCR1_HALHC|nr:rod-binding protein [Halobacteroides halobius]AGB42320.1 Rod binding protein [Halobacteroides halobius DSM 5150]